jgi:hypothetical protein
MNVEDFVPGAIIAESGWSLVVEREFIVSLLVCVRPMSAVERYDFYAGADDGRGVTFATVTIDVDGVTAAYLYEDAYIESDVELLAPAPVCKSTAKWDKIGP